MAPYKNYGQLLGTAFFVLSASLLLAAQPQLPITINIHPNTKYAPGVYTFGPTAIPVNAVAADFVYETNDHTDPVVCWSVTSDISMDGGAIWKPTNFATRCGAPGFDHDDKKTPKATASFTIPFPDPANPNRQIRGQLNVKGGVFRTSGSVTIR